LAFPWLLAGYALTDYFPLARLARWTGVYGLSYLVVAVNVAWVWIFMRRNKWQVINLAATLAILLLLSLTAYQDTYPQDRKAYLVQTNIPEEVASEPWTLSSQAQLLGRLRMLTLEAVGREMSPALVIWPEVPAPFYFDENSFSRQFAEDIARQTHSYF